MDFETSLKNGRAEYREPGRRVRVFAVGADVYDLQADLFSGTFGGQLSKQEVRARLLNWRIPLEHGWLAA